MQEVKNFWTEIQAKIDSYKSGGINAHSYWKIIVSFYIILFIGLIIGGWVFYGWSVSDTGTSVKTKTVKPDITLEDIRKVEDITTEKKDKLDEVIESDVRIIELK